MHKHLRCFLFLIFLVVMPRNTVAEDKPQPVERTQKTQQSESSIDKASQEEQISYALGYDIFDKLKSTIELDSKYFLMGTEDSLGNTPKLTQDQLKNLLMSYQRIARQKQIEAIKSESEKNRAEGMKFLDENKKQEGVISLSSGLQYKVLTQGTGSLPKELDIIECHYKGTLIDGTVFDSSYQRGKPAVFQLGGVIKGWIEALQKMKVGSKWMLYIPPELAYGDQGAGLLIKPGATLIFEVEILSIVE